VVGHHGGDAVARVAPVPSFFASMLSTASLLLAALFKVALPVLALIALIDLATMSRPRRVRLLRRQGLTWRQIADRYGVKSASTPARWAAA
jgi:hypothetical protein